MALPNLEDRWLYRVGGASGLLLALGYLVIMAIYVPIGAPPRGVESMLTYMGGNTMAWWGILGLSVATDFLFLPVAYALYTALKPVHRNGMVLAATCVALFVILDLALTWTNYAAMITFSARYASAVSEAQRSAIVAVANYPAAILQSGLLFVYNTLVLAAGILFTGYVMLVQRSPGRGSRILAWLGLATGGLGVVSVVGSFFGDALSAAIIVTSLLTTVWVGWIGARLWSMSRASLVE